MVMPTLRSVGYIPGVPPMDTSLVDLTDEQLTTYLRYLAKDDDAWYHDDDVTTDVAHHAHLDVFAVDVHTRRHKVPEVDDFVFSEEFHTLHRRHHRRHRFADGCISNKVNDREDILTSRTLTRNRPLTRSRTRTERQRLTRRVIGDERDSSLESECSSDSDYGESDDGESDDGESDDGESDDGESDDGESDDDESTDEDSDESADDESVGEDG